MQVEVGSILEGKVTGITNFGAFVELPEGKVGMVHISEVAISYVKEIRDHLKEDQVVKVKVLTISPEGKISLSIKKAIEQLSPPPRKSRPSGGFGRPSGGFSRPPFGGSRGRNDGPAKPDNYDWQNGRKTDGMSFEDMMQKFKQQSDEKISDLKRGAESKNGGFSRRGGSR